MLRTSGWLVFPCRRGHRNHLDEWLERLVHVLRHGNPHQKLPEGRPDGMGHLFQGIQIILVCEAEAEDEDC
jgi:hypothetical protein